MSDTSGIVKEFLVSLGFVSGEKDLKKFRDGIDKATKLAGQLATGAEAMATAVAAAVVKISSKFEDLYYASIRMNDSVENIRGMSFAIGQVGGSAQGAMQALENMAEFFRSNPGAERFVQGLGVETRNANGELRGMTEVMGELAGKLRAMPYYRAKVVAGVLGIDPRTLQAMLRDTGEAQAKYHDLAQRMGVDQDRAAKASHDFMNDVRELVAVVTLAADRVVLAIQPWADKVVRWFEDLDRSTAGWSTSLIALAVVLAPILALVGPTVVAVAALAAGFAALWADLEQWRGGGKSVIDWSEWAGEIDGVVSALRPLGDVLVRLGGDVLALAQKFWQAFGPAIKDAGHLLLTEMVGGIHLLTNALTVICDLLELNWAKAWTDAKKLASQAIQDVVANLKGAGRAVSDFLYPLFHHGDAPPHAPGSSAANDNRPSSAAQAGQAAAAAGKGVASHISDFLKRNGLSSAQAAGVTAGVGAESRFDPNAINPTSGAFGIGQWLGSRKAELFKRYGQHPSLDQQLQFMLWELMGGDSGGGAVRGAGTAKDALSAYITKFMRPGPGSAGDLARGGAYLSAQIGGARLGSPPAAVSVNQNTNIHVHGVSDPADAARQVHAGQGRVNGDLVRNLKSAAS